MQHVISVANMRESDAATIAAGISGTELMMRAAKGIHAEWNWTGHTAIVAGSGNNAGDGYALACILADENASVSIHLTSEKTSKDGSYYLQMARDKGVAINTFDPSDPLLKSADTLVDCLLGTGFSGTPRKNIAAAIDFINISPAKVVSADINSGLDAETGCCEKAVKSDLTVSIGYLKNGMFCNQACDYIGQLVNAPIGINLECTENELLDEAEFDALLDEYNGRIMPFPEDDVATESFGMIENVELQTPTEGGCKIASVLHVHVLVTGHSTQYLCNGSMAAFRRPSYMRD